jgi:hypothetical protein
VFSKLISTPIIEGDQPEIRFDEKGDRTAASYDIVNSQMDGVHAIVGYIVGVFDKRDNDKDV